MSEAAISLPTEGLAWCGFTINNSKIIKFMGRYRKSQYGNLAKYNDTYVNKEGTYIEDGDKSKLNDPAILHKDYDIGLSNHGHF